MAPHKAQTTFTDYFYSKDGRLYRQDFYANDKYNSTKLFLEDSRNNMIHMISSDTFQVVGDTIVSYTFQNGLLVKHVHFDTNTGEMFSYENYKYENGRLISIIGEGSEGEVNWKVKTDAYGNVVRMDLLGQEFRIRVVMTYDDKYNPYYQLPDFIDTRYFCQNNAIETRVYIDGELREDEQTLEFMYRENGFPSKLVDTFSQGVHTTTFTYACD